MSTWNSNIGKFKKKDPNHGWLWRWLKDNWEGFWSASWRCCKNCKCDKKQNEKETKKNLFKD